MSERAEPVARPLRADARRNRDLVLAVAREVLSVAGASASFDEIARQAGVGVGTVYRHFPTRTALFEAIVVGRIEEFVGRARGLAASDTAPESAFRDFFGYLVGEISLNQALCEALDDDTAFAVPDRLRHDFTRWFETLLSQAQNAGGIRRDVDIADVLDLLVSTAAAERRARLRGNPNRSIAIVLDGLRAR